MIPVAPEKQQIDAVLPACIEIMRQGFRPTVAVDNWGYTATIYIPGVRDLELLPWEDLGDFLVADEEAKVHWLHPTLRAELDKITHDMILESLPSWEYPDHDARHSGALKMMAEVRADLAALDQRMGALAPFIASLTGADPAATPAAAWAFIEEQIADCKVDPHVGWMLAGRLTGVHPFVEYRLPDPSYYGYCIASYLDPEITVPGAMTEGSLDRALCLAVEDEEILDASLKKHAALIIAEALRLEQLPASLLDFHRVTLQSKRACIAQIRFGHFDPPEMCDLTKSASRLSRIIGAYLAKSNHEGLALLAAGNGRLRALGRAPVLTAEVCLEHYNPRPEIPF